MKFLGCKHLNFDKKKYDSRLEQRALPGGVGAYWHRPDILLPDEFCAADVQFCNLRGRLNSKVACLKGMAECGEYSEIEHDVEVVL